MLGWVHPYPQYTSVMGPRLVTTLALDAFEAGIGDLLQQDVFRMVGFVAVKRDEVDGWARSRALNY